MSRAIKFTLIAALVAALLGAAALVVLVQHGFSARDQPMAIEAFVARRLRILAIPRAAREMKNPITSLSKDVLAEGRAHFADHCATCHANDGSGNTEIGQNLYPPAPDMRKDWTQSLTDGELFYIIHNGIRFTGMPAWGPEDPAEDEDSWKLVYFIRHLPEITETELAEMKRMNPKSPQEMEEQQEVERFLRGEDTPPKPRHH